MRGTPSLLPWLLRRLATLACCLLGVTFAVFAIFEYAPVDRAAIAVARQQADGNFPDQQARDRALQQLRRSPGQVGSSTEPLPQRYLQWLGSALPCWPARPDPATQRAWQRLAAALPRSLLLATLALGLALAVGVLAGTRLAFASGKPGERAASGLLLWLAAMPEFLLGSLAIFWLGPARLGLLPGAGLASPGAEAWPWPLRWLDLLAHLLLPVLVLASGPLVLIVRFLRDSLPRSAAAPFARQWRALGVGEDFLRARLLRNAAAPLATLAGSLLPMLVGGSILVENLFALDGMGHLALTAVLELDRPLAMAILLVSASASLLALLLSDLMHRWLDPRVRLLS